MEVCQTVCVHVSRGLQAGWHRPGKMLTNDKSHKRGVRLKRRDPKVGVVSCLVGVRGGDGVEGVGDAI